MSPSNQAELADLWAAGGRHIHSADHDGKPWVYSFCPGCGWKLTGKFSTCPRCGADLKTKACSYCRGLIPKDTKRCPRCTADIE